MTSFTRADVCAVAIAELFRDAGAILASPIGVLPSLGARLAKATFAPELLLTDGVASLLCDVRAPAGAVGRVEGWLPYRAVFDLVWAGRRHVVMGAAQIDRLGNQNIARIGDAARPKAQLLGPRGAPGNTLNHATSYWVPAHSPRVFVARVDCVTGVGNDRAARLGRAARFHDLRGVVTNLCVLDFGSDDRGLRIASLHPGVAVDDVRRATGFALDVKEPLQETRAPTPEELLLLAELDPDGARTKEVPS